jgi:hypothetical protein
MMRANTRFVVSPMAETSTVEAPPQATPSRACELSDGVGSVACELVPW